MKKGRFFSLLLCSALFPAWNLWNDLAGGFSRQPDMLLGHIKHSALSRACQIPPKSQVKHQNCAHNRAAFK